MLHGPKDEDDVGERVSADLCHVGGRRKASSSLQEMGGRDKNVSKTRGSPIKTLPCFFLQRDDLYSEYGFSGLDETASSVVTDASAGNNSNNGGNTVRKGLLWQQRDRLFSRWKERFFVLTPDYLQCFRRGTSRLTEMGGFVFKVRLSEVESVDLTDRRGYLTVVVAVRGAGGTGGGGGGSGGGEGGGGKILLRKPEGIREWFNDIKVRERIKGHFLDAGRH